MLDQDRRRADRLLLPSPIAGRVADRDVRIVDIGILGTRIEHDEPLMAGPHTLHFDWDGEAIAVDCTLLRTESSEATFRSGMQFSDRDRPLVGRIVSTLADRDEMERLRTLVEASKLINSSIEPDTLFASILPLLSARPLPPAPDDGAAEGGPLFYLEEEKKGEFWTKAGGGRASDPRLP